MEGYNRNSPLKGKYGDSIKGYVSERMLLKDLRVHGHNQFCTTRAIAVLLNKHGVFPSKEINGIPYYIKRNASDCVERNMYELFMLALKLSEKENSKNVENQEDSDEDEVNYGRNDMSSISRELLANDGVFGADENELYRTVESKRIVNISEGQYKRLFENLDNEGFSMKYSKTADGKTDFNNPYSVEFIPNKKGGYSDTSIFKDGTKEFNVRYQHLPKCGLDSINLYFINNMNINKAVKHGINIAGNKVNVDNEHDQESIEYFKKRSAYYISRILHNLNVYPDLFTSPQSSSNFNKEMLMLLNRYYPEGDITVMPSSMKKDVKNMRLNIKAAKELGLSDEEIAFYQNKLTKYKKDEDIRDYRRKIEHLKQEIASLMTGKRGRPSIEVSNRKKQIDAYNTLIKTNRTVGRDSTVNADGSIKPFQIKSFDDRQRKILDDLFVFNDVDYPSKNYNGKEYQQYMKFNGKVIVVFDDNISSGATLDMMCNELLKYNPKKIIPITLGQIPLTAYSSTERGGLEKRA